MHSTRTINASVTGRWHDHAMLSLDSPSGLVVILLTGVLLVLWGVRPSIPNGPARIQQKTWQAKHGKRRFKSSPRKSPPRLIAPNHVRKTNRTATSRDGVSFGPIAIIDPREQLKAVAAAPFVRQRVLSASEARVFTEAERAIAKLARPWRVMAQVSLGEVLRTADRQAFSAINSKRVDLLIVDELQQPIAAVEYQGTGHWQGTGAARDAVKKEALRKAGIEYIEMMAGVHLPSDLHREIARLAQSRPTTLA